MTAAASELPSSVKSYVAATGAGVLLTLEQGFPRGVRAGLQNRRAGEPTRRRTVIKQLVGLAEGIRAQTQRQAAVVEVGTVVVAAAIFRSGRVLGGRRADSGGTAEDTGSWEFPGGKAEPGESDAAALMRECAEELSVAVTVGAQLGPDVVLPSGSPLRLFACALSDSAQGDHAPEPTADPSVHAEMRWFGPDELAEVSWLRTNERWLPMVRHELLSWR